MPLTVQSSFLLTHFTNTGPCLFCGQAGIQWINIHCITLTKNSRNRNKKDVMQHVFLFKTNHSCITSVDSVLGFKSINIYLYLHFRQDQSVTILENFDFKAKLLLIPFLHEAPQIANSSKMIFPLTVWILPVPHKVQYFLFSCLGLLLLEYIEQFFLFPVVNEEIRRFEIHALQY